MMPKLKLVALVVLLVGSATQVLWPPRLNRVLQHHDQLRPAVRHAISIANRRQSG